MSQAARTRDSLIGILALVILGYGALRWVAASRPEPPVAPPRTLSAVAVAVRDLELASVEPRVQGFGTLRAARRAQLGAERAARIVEVHADWRSGAEVPAGAQLVVLDSEELLLERGRLVARLAGARASLDGARDEVAQAESGLILSRERLAGLEREEERWNELFESGHANESQRDAARRARNEAAIALEQATARGARARSEERRGAAAVDELESQRALVDLRIERSRVVAPFRGHLTTRAPGLGSLVQPGEVLGELVDISTLHLVLKIPEDSIAAVELGLEVEIRVPSQPESVRRGRVASIGVLADPGTRAFDVEVDVPNDPRDAGDPARGDGLAGLEPLREGQFAQATVRLGRMDDVLAVDQNHFTVRGGRAIAFVWREREDGQGAVAEERELELGPRVGEAQVVFSGILAGERLITAPLAYLSDGAPVVLRAGADGDRPGAEARAGDEPESPR